MNQKNIFKQFLERTFPERVEALLGAFKRYHAWLVSENSKINLFSRQMDTDDIWTVHFLDSLLSTKYVEFGGRGVLDFGTGGGLPGIPLAIVFPDAKVTLLDSKKKKIAAVREAVETLGLGNCEFSDQRIEDIAGRCCFDIIVSRSVKIEPAYKPILLRLLKPGGKIVLYKSKVLDDVHQFDNAEIFDAEAAESGLGERRIVVIGSLPPRKYLPD
ncbi:16S rRNA methyltransferase [Fibrobacteres bacterium R8-0-B4]